MWLRSNFSSLFVTSRGFLWSLTRCFKKPAGGLTLEKAEMKQGLPAQTIVPVLNRLAAFLFQGGMSINLEKD